MRAMIMAETEEDRAAPRSTSCCRSSRSDFEGLFEEMAGLPVTIRLLDPPLHEFLPHEAEVAQEVERARIERATTWRSSSATLERVHELTETNPMLGTRGVPARDPAPRDLRDAGARDRARRAGRAASAARRPQLEIMIPLVAYEQELELMRELVERIVEEEGGGRLDLTVGTMIELPRACFVADRIAEPGRLLLVRHERPDADRARVLARRRGGQVPGEVHRAEDRRPQPVRDDRRARRRLARAAGGVGRAARPSPDLKLGICGEHGGDPDSIAFFHMAGLDYVSCSPYRVPIARVAAAQAAIRASSSP